MSKAPGEPRRRARKSRADNSIAVRRHRSAAGCVSISACGAAVLLDEGDVRGAAAERLDPDRAGAGIAVEQRARRRSAARGC